jgi:hypothetical protein
MSDDPGSVAHFESLLRVLKQLEPHKIKLYEHQYHPQAFGSFVVALGNPHERVTFSWDGRECILTISTAKFPNRNANAPWTHRAHASLPNGHGLFEEIASTAEQILV